MFDTQLERECKIALIALNEIKEYLNKPSSNSMIYFWYSVDSFLSATSNISKIFWTPSSKSDSKARSKELRGIYNIKDDSPFNDRTLRNHFEHFDERLDTWFSSSKHHNVFDSNIMSLDSVKGIDLSDTLRNFDPKKLQLYFMGDNLDLNTLEDALNQLQKTLKIVPFDVNNPNTLFDLYKK